MNQQATLSASLLAKFPVLEKIRALPKPVLLGAAAALVALIVAVAMWSSEPKYKVLFSNLDDRDGGAIVTALGTMNVPYKYNDTGTALLVPADRVYDARLQLASQGLPRGGSVGFELMDNARFGASQFAEQINYQRGLEGELARSIESMHTVQHARVHLAMPRQSLFVRERQPPTASVLLNVYPGRSLSDAQVSAISWLVASSVPELTAENVSIVDQNGRLLSAPTGEGRGMDADQMRMVRETEQRTVERILTILNPLVGPGNVHAQASAEMDFSRREETSEVYRPNQEPGQAAIRSQQTSESNQRGINPAQGVPGALSNQPPANAQAPIANPPQTQPPRPGQPQQQGQQQQQQTTTGARAPGARGPR
ncbi:flagellar basal-body MS-ring/collar protein FliF, partial [Achromobacter xylosoxidans]|uniref:flagellar basal-body MS-ring/collar protein FliF n=4 Tax=Alcaligenes xylosoxydans xylosoxydans TaxID=85698 RepID=UPI001F13E65C